VGGHCVLDIFAYVQHHQADEGITMLPFLHLIHLRRVPCSTIPPTIDLRT
jgi:hypothetical protein